MNTIDKYLALAVWIACTVLIMFGFGQPETLILAIVAGYYYLSRRLS